MTEQTWIGAPSSEREAYRARKLAAVPRWYRAWLHLGATSAIGVGLAVPALLGVRDFRGWHVPFAALVFVLANALEWRAHKGLLHQRKRFFEPLYDQHTPIHHRLFVSWDMAVRDAREYRFVLIPPYGIFTIFLVSSPLAGLLAVAGQRDAALIFVAVSMLYVAAYEWLHAAYHAPEASWVGRRGAVRFLRRHHQAHHDPLLMQRWNFNVTLPLWDWVRGTLAPPGAARLAEPVRGAVRRP